MTRASQPVTDPLAIAALDTERHVGSAGWDQPPRLFALVPTAELLSREPQLAAGLSVSDQIEGALTAIEQEDLPATDSIESRVGQIAWPDTGGGCALVLERLGVPPDAERDRPTDHDAALAELAEHPDRRDVRLLAATTRDGSSICLLRQREHDSDDRVATGSDIAPGLVAALRATLTD